MGLWFTLSRRFCAPLVQVPDFVNARISGEACPGVIKDDEWLRNGFTATVSTRGGALIKKWGRSSAASTAVSIADAIKVHVLRTTAIKLESVCIRKIGYHYLYNSLQEYCFPFTILEYDINTSLPPSENGTHVDCDVQGLYPHPNPGFGNAALLDKHFLL